jgi:enoyl-CoA hydratase/carnithine racemase
LEEIRDVSGNNDSIAPKSFLYEEADNGVATITLNRPERLNALTFEVYEELTATFERLKTRRNVRVVLITGAGRGFCSGGDVNDIIGRLFERDSSGLLEFTRLTCALVDAMRSLDTPIVASLNGTVAGAGAVIALASDFRIASETARIAFLFVRVGLSGADMGSAFLLPRVVGLARATEMLMLGDFVTSEDARRFGLYNKVVPAEHLHDESRLLAERLAAGPGFALRMTKQMLNRELSVGLAEALEMEAQAQAICMGHPDYREAYEAFVAKRPPLFNGADNSDGA